MKRFEVEAINKLPKQDRESIKVSLLNKRANGCGRDFVSVAKDMGISRETVQAIEEDPMYIESLLRKLNAKFISSGDFVEIYNKLVECSKAGSIKHMQELFKLLGLLKDTLTIKKEDKPNESREYTLDDEDSLAIHIQEITQRQLMDAEGSGSFEC